MVGLLFLYLCYYICMSSPEHQVNMSPPDYEHEMQQPFNVGESALLGGALAAFVSALGVIMVEATNLGFNAANLNINVLTPPDLELIGGSASLGAVAFGGLAYASHRFREWREARKGTAVIDSMELATKVDEIANQEYVNKGMFAFRLYLSKPSSRNKFTAPPSFQ